uniref:Uncharacterized protein n=1 Tax=viral metagenome TaxID=1070528 RepID=A0A6M3JN95_9ZZZZ
MKKDFYIYIKVDDKKQTSEVRRLLRATGYAKHRDGHYLSGYVKVYPHSQEYSIVNSNQNKDCPTYHFSDHTWRKLLLPEWQELIQETTMKKIAIRVHDRRQAHALDALLGGLISNWPWGLTNGTYLFPDKKTVGWNDSDDTNIEKLPSGYTPLDFRYDMPAICEFFETKEDKPPFEKIDVWKVRWYKDGIRVDRVEIMNEELEAAYYYQCCRDAMYEGIDFCFYKNEKGEASFDSNIVKPCDFLPLAKALLRLHWENEQ